MAGYKVKRVLTYDKISSILLKPNGKGHIMRESGELPSVLYYVFWSEINENILNGGSIRREIKFAISEDKNCSEFPDPKKWIAGGEIVFKISNGVSQVKTWTIKQYNREVGKKIMDWFNRNKVKDFIDTPHKCISRLFRNHNICNILLTKINEEESIPGATKKVENLKVNLKDEGKAVINSVKLIPKDNGYILENGEVPSVLRYAFWSEKNENILNGDSIERGDTQLVISKDEISFELLDPQKRIAGGEIVFKIINGVSQVDTWTITQYYREAAEKMMDWYNHNRLYDFINTPHKFVSRLFRNHRLNHIFLDSINIKDSIPGAIKEVENIKKDEKKAVTSLEKLKPKDNGYILESGELPSVLYYVFWSEKNENILNGDRIKPRDIQCVMSKDRNCSEFPDPKKRIAGGEIVFKISNGVSEIDTWTIKQYNREVAEKIMDWYNWCNRNSKYFFINTPHRFVSRLFRNHRIPHIFLDDINEKDSIPGATKEVENLKVNVKKDEEKVVIKSRTAPVEDLCR